MPSDLARNGPEAALGNPHREALQGRVYGHQVHTTSIASKEIPERA
jgi:hypothetical protein